MSAGVRTPTFRPVDPGPGFDVPVRGRAFLAGSAHESFPATVPDAGDMILVFVVDRADHPHPVLTAAARDVVDDVLPRAGGVLLRGLPLADKADFERIVEQLGYGRAGYEGGIAVRRNDASVALTASDEDRRITLSPHNEMAYLPTYPRKVFFFCQRPAASGGEVPVNDIRDTAAIIPEHVKDSFRDRGIRYHRNLPKGSDSGERGWADTFGTDDPALVEQRMAAAGHDFEWAADGTLHYAYDRAAFLAHPETGEELWFNQVTELHCSYWRSHPGFPPDLPDDAYPATTTYGDGSPIDEDLISALRGALWSTSRAVRMTQGDVLVLDNQVLQHGRFSFEGPRRHLVSLAR